MVGAIVYPVHPGVAVKSMDGASAIWANDAKALDQALASGWSLPRAQLKSGSARDISLPLFVVSSGWLEGWKTWLRHDPGISTNQTIIETALSQAQFEILQEIILVNEGSLPWDRDDSLMPHHILFQLIGSQMGKQVPSENIVKTAKLLGSSGVDVLSVYPGEFEPGSWAQPGHTLWSWALVWGYWDVAEGLEVGDEAFSMPLAATAMDRWFEKSWVPDWVSNANPSLRIGADFARETWLRWMDEERFSAWCKISDAATNTENHGYIKDMPEKYQQILWPFWLSREGKWSPLHDLVSSSLAPQEILSTLVHLEKMLPPEAWVAGWEGEDEFGMSANSIWSEKRA